MRGPAIPATHASHVAEDVKALPRHRANETRHNDRYPLSSMVASRLLFLPRLSHLLAAPELARSKHGSSATRHW